MTNAALLVGVNKYENGNDLRGCCNDVDNVHGVLVDILGYRPSEIVVLKDGDATMANMLKHLHALVGRLTKDDIGFFHFSGHGSQVADKDGDEADRKDELICPHDMSWVANRYITDDDLYTILRGVPEGAYVEVLLDSCHAGTGIRTERRLYSPRVKSIISPHVGLDLPVRRMRRSVQGLTPNSVLWAGCEDGQLSSDAYLGGEYNGAFTYFWAKCLRDDPNILRHKLLPKVRAELKSNGFDQIPQLEVVK